MNITTIVKYIFISLFIIWSGYSFYTFCSDSKSVYVFRKDLSIKDVELQYDGDYNARDLHFKKAYDAEDNSDYSDNFIAESYQWSKFTSIHRLIFLDKDEIKNCLPEEKIYLNLYKGNYALFFDNKVFGLNVGKAPSKLYLLSDYFRESTKPIAVYLIFLWYTLTWFEKKFLKSSNLDNLDIAQSVPTPLVILFAILVFFF